MQKAELRVSDTPREPVRSARTTGYEIGRDDGGAEGRRRAKKLALFLMVASSLVMVGLILVLWLTWGALL